MTRYFTRMTSKAQAALLCAVVAVAAGSASADSKVVLVEEHWELRLSQPDSERSAPQTTMVMSPVNHLNDVHFLFSLNHVAVPDYQAGGMQVQLWEGGDLQDYAIANKIGALHHDDEVVRWVQRLTLDGGFLKFQIVNGESETWQTFGGDDLSLTAPTLLDRLNDYRPGVSLTESQVSYAENRVESLVLTKLVWVTDTGEVYEQSAPIPIDTSLDP